VLPSYREGLPRVLLEAGAMGKPLIATDVPGCRHITEEGVNGFLCAARDSSSLGAAMLRMLRLPAEARAAMGTAARARVEADYDERIVVRRYLEAIEAAVSGK
jgi:glycosyltransferase involved in cell wall biosynthesis